MSIGENIKQRRLALGMTQKQLAEKCGTVDSAIRKYESGKINPKIETLKKIADALDCRWPALLDMPGKDEVMTITKNEAGELFTEIRPKDEAEEEQTAKDEAYINKLAVPALKLNDTGRELLFNDAEKYAAIKELTE